MFCFTLETNFCCFAYNIYLIIDRSTKKKVTDQQQVVPVTGTGDTTSRMFDDGLQAPNHPQLVVFAMYQPPSEDDFARHRFTRLASVS